MKKFLLIFTTLIILVEGSCTDTNLITGQHISDDFLVELIANEEDESPMLQITRGENEVHLLPINHPYISLPIPFDNVTILAVQDLDNDDEPEIILDIFTPGSNCCTNIFVFFYDQGAETYKSGDFLSTIWSISPKLVDIQNDNYPEFVTRNPHHPWLAPPAASVGPIQIYRFDDGRFIDVTLDYPDLILEDANMWLTSAQGEVAVLSPEYLAITEEDPVWWATSLEGNENTVLSTYLYEMHLLGKGNEGLSNVSQVCKGDNCADYFEQLQVVILQDRRFDSAP